MKKRTLVCFLIFTLCVFYTSIPNTVFGQEVSLAQQVIKNHGETLKRPEIHAGFLLVLDNLKKNPASRDFLSAATINLVIDNPALLNTLIDPEALTTEEKAALDRFLPLLVAKDEGVVALLRDAQVLALLKDSAASDELANLLLPDPVTPDPVQIQ